MGWAGLGRASLGQPARCRLSRRSRGPWVKPLTVSRRRPALSELRRLLCTCTEMAAVEQCHASLARRKGGGRSRGSVSHREAAPPTGEGGPLLGPGPGWRSAGHRAGLPRPFTQVGGGREAWALQVWLPRWAQVQPARAAGRGRGSGLVEDAAPVCGSGPEHAHPAFRLGRHGHTQCPVHPDDPRSGGAQLSHLRAGGAPPTRGEGSWLSGGVRAACSPCRGPAH